MTLIYDSETSGFGESRLLQLGCLLVDASYKSVAEISVLVQPVGWKIEPGAEAVHGISQEKAEKYGLPVEEVLSLWVRLCQRAEVCVCHNAEFDRKIVAGELAKAGWPSVDKRHFCTMQEMTGVCQIPASEKQKRAGFGEWKKSKLVEAYWHAFGEGFEGAHDAMADCRATARLYQWIKERGKAASVAASKIIGGSEPCGCVPVVTLGNLWPPPPPMPTPV